MPPEFWRSEMERSRDSGIYLLLIHLPEGRDIEVGALGRIHFNMGFYIYIGSAQRNLRRRIERHLRREKKLKWHVDYLLQYAHIQEYHIFHLGKEWEARIAEILCERYPYIKGFGSSDSRAPSHLIFIGSKDEWDEILGEIRYMATQYPELW